MANRFNLIDEPWIPLAGAGVASLKQVFSAQAPLMLGGNPIQKMALMKLLQAISQAAVTPADEAEWESLTIQDFAQRCRAYLNEWHGHFYLYGDRPFLQMPAIAAAEVKSYGAVLPEIATGNTTIVFQTQHESPLSDAEKATLLVTQMGFALAGKKVDNSVVLTAGYKGKQNEKGKPSSGKAGPSVGFMGYLHSIAITKSLLGSLYLNLLTAEKIRSCGHYAAGVGIPPWERMPDGEDCAVARDLRGSLMGRLVPLSRFCLLADPGLHYSEGIQHPDYKSGGVDPTLTINRSGKDPKVLWVQPEKRPWRELSALLGIVTASDGGSESLQLSVGIPRAARLAEPVAIWSGGLSLSANAGEQYCGATDDYVDSITWLTPDAINADSFQWLSQELLVLNDIEKAMRSGVMGYLTKLGRDPDTAKRMIQKAITEYWRQCEVLKDQLIAACAATHVERALIRLRFIEIASRLFDSTCSQETARQIAAWASSKPNFRKFKQEESK